MKREDNRDIPKNHARIRAQLLQLYGFFDLLTGEEIPEFKEGSYHHIIKEEFGGEYTLENGAMLLHSTHDYIHNSIETHSPELFDLLTECILLYKCCLDNNYTHLIEQFQLEVQPLIKEYKEQNIIPVKKRKK